VKKVSKENINKEKEDVNDDDKRRMELGHYRDCESLLMHSNKPRTMNLHKKRRISFGTGLEMS